MSPAPSSCTPQPLRLAIAGIPFAVLSDRPGHDKWIRSAYRQFSTSETPEIQLSILTSPRRTLASAPQADWDGPCWNLESKYFHLREVEPRRNYQATVASNTGIADLLRTWFSMVLLARGGLLLHATGVVLGRRALLFAGPSGSGKTTLARLAASLRLLSDESVAIVPDGAGRNGKRGFRACGTPFFGELTQAVVNERVPVGDVFLISGNRPAIPEGQCRIAEVSPARAVGELLAQTFLRTLSPHALNALLPLLEAFVRSVRIRRLDFSPTPEFWKAIDAQSE